MNSVSEVDFGVASGINNAVSRVAGLIAVAVLGVVLSASSSRALDRHLSALNLPPPIRAEINVERRYLGAAEVSGTGRAAIQQSFVTGYRYVVWVAVVLALQAPRAPTSKRGARAYPRIFNA